MVEHTAESRPWRTYRSRSSDERLYPGSLALAEGSLQVTSPKVRQYDHAGGRRVRTPHGRECVALDGDHNQQDGKVRSAKNTTIFMPEKKRAANQIKPTLPEFCWFVVEYRYRLFDVKLQWEKQSTPTE